MLQYKMYPAGELAVLRQLLIEVPAHIFEYHNNLTDWDRWALTNSKTLIRLRRMQRLIRVYSVCHTYSNIEIHQQVGE